MDEYLWKPGVWKIPEDLGILCRRMSDVLCVIIGKKGRLVRKGQRRGRGGVAAV